MKAPIQCRSPRNPAPFLPTPPPPPWALTERVPRAPGQVIVGNRRRLRGTIRYYGPTLFAEGEWVGMELEVPEGKNDGTVKVRRMMPPLAVP